MAVTLLLATQVGAAALMLLLAAWLVALRFTDPVNRAFALFLLVRAGTILGFRASEVSGGARLWDTLARASSLAVIPCLAYFLVVYAGPRRIATSPARWSLLLAAIGIELLFIVDRCLNVCVTPSGRQALGPLALLEGYGAALAFAIAALVLALLRRKAKLKARKAALFLVSSAFLLNAVLDASIALGVLADVGIAAELDSFEPSPWPVLAVGAAFAALAVAALVLVLHARSAEGEGERRGLRNLLLGAAAACATGLFVGSNPGSYASLGIVLIGLWRLALPALVVFAILRHQLFGLDVKVRWTIKRGTLAGIFIAAFFVVEQLVQNVLSSELGVVAGAVGAGLLLFALSPLQKLAEHVAEAALPGVKAVGEMSREERLRLYREQASLAWSDGVITREERTLLDHLRQALGLGDDEAHRLEREAVAVQDRPA